MPRDSYTVVDGRALRLSNLDKILFPAVRYRKADMIRYYRLIAPVLLPHLHERPLTLKRYPGGVDQEYFYEKRCPSHRPEWVKTASHLDIPYCLVNDRATLVWAANLANIEVHTSLARAANYECPTMMAFDLDPGAPANVIDCARIGLRLRELFDQLGLQCFPKTSGSKGMQVYVPLNRTVSYEDTKEFSRSVAELLERRYPDEVVSRMAKKLRPGKVFIDWSQNDRNKTTVCVYSLRANPSPTVSTPLEWKELERARKVEDLAFSPEQVLERVKRMGDLFLPVLELSQKLPPPEALRPRRAA